MIEESLKKIFDARPEMLYGYTDISYSSFAKDYRSALVFAVPYGQQLTLTNYTEQGFEDGIAAARDRLEQTVAEIEAVLKQENIKYYVPPVAQENEQELEAAFSYKFAAVNAGLGWIGRNDVVITKRYGPRVRLSAILIDHLFTYGTKYTASQCPSDCRKCVDICPHKALTGATWNIEMQRREIINYQLCNQKRSEFIRLHGRKSAWGLCLAACPCRTNLK